MFRYVFRLIILCLKSWGWTPIFISILIAITDCHARQSHTSALACEYTEPQAARRVYKSFELLLFLVHFVWIFHPLNREGRLYVKNISKLLRNYIFCLEPLWELSEWSLLNFEVSKCMEISFLNKFFTVFQLIYSPFVVSITTILANILPLLAIIFPLLAKISHF